MSVTVLREGDGTHRCELPFVYAHHIGSLIRCDGCGRYYQLHKPSVKGRAWKKVNRTAVAEALGARAKS